MDQTVGQNSTVQESFFLVDQMSVGQMVFDQKLRNPLLEHLKLN